MLTHTATAISAASIFFSLPVSASLYPKSSKVLQLNQKSYEQLIVKSNYTSIVEFYAPWCGHCKNLQPAYEKAAINLQGLANVAAVDCDDETNKPFCGSMGVQGFPTLKIVRPSKKAGRPVIEDYQGARAAKAIVDAVVEKIPNHVAKLTDKGLDAWLTAGNDTVKALLFSDKGTTSALLRALAIDYLGSIPFAQVRDKEKTTVSTFGVTKYPTFMVLPGGDKDAVVYSGEVKKIPMGVFVKEASGISPNPVASPASTKKTEKKTNEKKKTEKKKAGKKAEDSKKPKAASATVEDDDSSTASPDPKPDVPPSVKINNGSPMIEMLEKEADLTRECLSTTSHICILCLLPTKEDKDALLPKEATQALISLAEVQQKHSRRHSLFPFYSIPSENKLGQKVRESLGLKSSGEIEVIAVNAKRMWWRHLKSEGFMPQDVESFVDAVKMNDGPRNKLPESLISEAPPAESEPEPEPIKHAEAPKPEQVPKPSECPHGHGKKGKKDKKADEPTQELPKPGQKIMNDQGLEVEVLEVVDDDAAPEPEPAATPDHNEL